MRRKDRQLTDSNHLETILERSPVCRLAFFDTDYPYIVPVNFGYSRGSLYIHSALEGKKIDLIRKDGRVCFEMEADAEPIEGETPCRWSMRYSSIVGFGRARLVEEAEEKKKGMEIIFSHYSRAPFEVPEDAIQSIALIRIDIESMTGKASGLSFGDGQE